MFQLLQAPLVVLILAIVYCPGLVDKELSKTNNDLKAEFQLY